MSRKGKCLDNSPMKTFIGGLMKQAVDTYIDDNGRIKEN